MELNKHPYFIYRACNAFISVTHESLQAHGPVGRSFLLQRGWGLSEITSDKANMDIYLAPGHLREQQPETLIPISGEKQFRGLTKGNIVVILVEHLIDCT